MIWLYYYQTTDYHAKPICIVISATIKSEATDFLGDLTVLPVYQYTKLICNVTSVAIIIISNWSDCTTILSLNHTKLTCMNTSAVLLSKPSEYL